MRLAIEELKKKTDTNTKNIELIFQYLDELLDKKENPAPRKQGVAEDAMPNWRFLIISGINTRLLAFLILKDYLHLNYISL